MKKCNGLEKIRFFSAALVFVLISCQQQDLLKDVEPINNDISSESVVVNDLGFLHFSSVASLEAYVDEIAGIHDVFANDAKKVKCIQQKKKVQKSLDGFVPIDSWRNQMKKSPSRIKSSIEDEDEDDVLTEDEQKLSDIEDLLYDGVLYSILDTTLRIQVEDTIYKITPYGTFSAENSKLDMLETTIATFDTNLINTLPIGLSVILDNGVVFTNTFGKDACVLESEDEENIDEEVGEKPAYAPLKIAAQGLHKPYNTNDYRYKSNDWQKFWSKYFNKSGHHQHSSKRRAYMTISNLDYGFLKTCVIRLKIQKKKWLGWYKMKTPAKKMVMGCNSLTINGIPVKSGVLSYENRTEVEKVLNRSFAFSVKIGMDDPLLKSVGGTAPTNCNLSDIDVFGSIWAENKWAGVRFYQH